MGNYTPPAIVEPLKAGFHRLPVHFETVIHLVAVSARISIASMDKPGFPATPNIPANAEQLRSVSPLLSNNTSNLLKFIDGAY
jgi:hypothetical protein